MNRPGAASTHKPELCFTRSCSRNFASSLSTCCNASMAENSAAIPRFNAASPSGRSRSISRVLSPESLAIATAKLQASIVVPAPPLDPMNAKSLPAGFFAGRVVGRRAAARTSASATMSGENGSVRNSRAPARMQRTSNSGSELSEYTITVATPFAQILSTSSSASSASPSRSMRMTSWSSSSVDGRSPVPNE